MPQDGNIFILPQNVFVKVLEDKRIKFYKNDSNTPNDPRDTFEFTASPDEVFELFKFLDNTLFEMSGEGIDNTPVELPATEPDFPVGSGIAVNANGEIIKEPTPVEPPPVVVSETSDTPNPSVLADAPLTQGSITDTVSGTIEAGEDQ